MSIREILSGKFGFLSNTTVPRDTHPTQDGTKAPSPKSFQGVGRNTFSPFDVRYGNQIVLQFRHDYIR